MKVDEVRTKMQALMDRDGLTYADIGSGCKVDPDSVRRFLEGAGCHRLTREAYERFIDSRELVSSMPAQSTSKLA